VGEALDQMRALTGLTRIGLIGARFGAMVAALVAERWGIEETVMISPVVSGKRFLSDLLRLGAFGRMSEAAGTADVTVGDLRRQIEDRGMVAIKGFPLTAIAAGELEGADLLTDLRGFRGRALLLLVSRTPDPTKEASALRDRLEGLGVAVSIDAITDPLAGQFGLTTVREAEKGHHSDLMARIHPLVTGKVRSWMDRTYPLAHTGKAGAI
jgi:pimeloyl-ACP methyl ester carboxylesterase